MRGWERSSHSLARISAPSRGPASSIPSGAAERRAPVNYYRVGGGHATGFMPTGSGRYPQQRPLTEGAAWPPTGCRASAASRSPSLRARCASPVRAT